METFVAPQALQRFLDDGWEIESIFIIENRLTYCLARDEKIDPFYFSMNLKNKAHYTGNIFNEDCAICRMSEHDNEIVTECGHLYHNECLCSWFVNHGTCPLCTKVIAIKMEM